MSGPTASLARIISGGQSGVDRAALDAALAAGFPCGGWCPADRRAEDGPIPERYPVTLFARFIAEHDIATLNVAGPSTPKAPALPPYVRSLLGTYPARIEGITRQSGMSRSAPLVSCPEGDASASALRHSSGECPVCRRNTLARAEGLL
ncbi:hypothetical protein EKG36_14450 [Halomonas nitroreducens]|uniref:Molybdenum cofactor carrier n=1 Tax=Halomonas nitroreducens TaxID=447425 RepID=A0A3S0I6G2_9GAMM|nr:hypothetical protein EKG36_14450 [Halomonas nitroreducens]